MDVIEKDVAMLHDKGFDIKCDTSYEVQERSVSGESWYSLGTFHTLDKAVECEMDHFQKWYSRLFDSPDEVESLRIVMRHVVEVVL